MILLPVLFTLQAFSYTADDQLLFTTLSPSHLHALHPAAVNCKCQSGSHCVARQSQFVLNSDNGKCKRREPTHP